jgi:hypothetical protein
MLNDPVSLFVCHLDKAQFALVAGSKGEVVNCRRRTGTNEDLLCRLQLLATSQVAINLGALDVEMSDGPSANGLRAAHVGVLPLELPLGKRELIEWESEVELGEGNGVSRVSLRVENDLQTL